MKRKRKKDGRNFYLFPATDDGNWSVVRLQVLVSETIRAKRQHQHSASKLALPLVLFARDCGFYDIHPSITCLLF